MKPQTPPGDIVSELTGYFSSILRMPAPQVVTDVHLLELGMDSIMLIEAQRWLKARFGVSIEVRRFFDDLNTIDHIAAFVAAAPQQTAANGVLADVPDGSSVRSALSDLWAGAAKAGGRYDLMRAQLALVADVIEAQNRTLVASRRSRDVSG